MLEDYRAVLVGLKGVLNVLVVPDTPSAPNFLHSIRHSACRHATGFMRSGMSFASGKLAGVTMMRPPESSAATRNLWSIPQGHFSSKINCLCCRVIAALMSCAYLTVALSSSRNLQLLGVAFGSAQVSSLQLHDVVTCWRSWQFIATHGLSH